MLEQWATVTAFFSKSVIIPVFLTPPLSGYIAVALRAGEKGGGGRGGGGGGGGAPPPPPPPPPPHHFQLLHVNMWDFNLFIEQDIGDKKYIAFSEVNGAVNWATTVTNNKKTE